MKIRNEDNVTIAYVTTLTNTHHEETSVNVKKVWEIPVIDGVDEAHQPKPEPITVQLYADGEPYGEPITLDTSNDWTGGWTKLPVHRNVDGVAKDIAYTVDEVEVPDGFTKSITGNTTLYTITNTYDIGRIVIRKNFEFDTAKLIDNGDLVDVPVVKSWNDNNDADGNRPTSITVRLLANGTEVASAQVTAATGWTYQFMGMPKFDDDGERINYTIREDPVPGYTTDINGFNIRNTYNPELTERTVRKIWNDDGNANNTRPTSIYVTLNNGITDVKTVILSVNNNWTATVEDLPVRVNGTEVTYTWTEQTVIGYDRTNVTVNGTVTEITNTLWQRQEEVVAEGAKRPGNMFYVFEEYETPLGVEVMINHVGDCFD